MNWKLIGKIFVAVAAWIGSMIGAYILGGKFGALLGNWIAEEL